MSGQERSIAEDVEYVLRGWYQQGLALANLDTIDVGLTPETYDYDKRIAVEVNLLCHLYYDAMHDEVWAVDEL